MKSFFIGALLYSNYEVILQRKEKQKLNTDKQRLKDTLCNQCSNAVWNCDPYVLNKLRTYSVGVSWQRLSCRERKKKTR